MKLYLSDYQVVFIDHRPNVSNVLLKTISSFKDPKVFVWSYSYPPFLDDFCRQNHLKITYVEDGFIRSFGLGVFKTQPLSLLFDTKGMHFDRSRTSNMDEILETFDFQADPQLMSQARNLITKFRKHRISKYTFIESSMDYLDNLHLDANQETILVLGQMEDDLSIRFGMTEKMTCNELVEKAARQNPDARILYRPHPESIHVHKSHYSRPEKVNHICDVIPQKVSLQECFQVSDMVYTMTSLAGFEAALYGLKVKTFGAPFYAGWGFTDDADELFGKQRNRQLSVEEVFAAAYILYPHYLNPISNTRTDLEDVLAHIISLKHFMLLKKQAENRPIGDEELISLQNKFNLSAAQLYYFKQYVSENAGAIVHH